MRIYFEENLPEWQKEAVYSGEKLRQIVTSDRIGDYRPSLNANQEFNGIFTAKIEQPSKQRVPEGASNLPLKIFFPNNIPCFSDGEPLKVHIQCHSLGFGHTFDLKSFRWWIKAYLIGSKHLLVGIHEKLILNQVFLCSLENLRKGQKMWNGRLCVTFLHSFMDKVKRTLNALPDGAILIATRKSMSREFQFAVASDKSGYGHHEFFGAGFLRHKWK